MINSLAQSLWLRQTTLTVMVVVIIATALACVEIVTSYDREYARQQQFSDHLIDTFSNAAARAAFHVDELQADTVINSLMQYDVLESASITTDLGVILATRNRAVAVTATDFFIDWLFSDVTDFKRTLIIDRSNFVAGLQLDHNDGQARVGELRFRTNSILISQSFIKNTVARMGYLAIELLVMATAIALMFHKTMTQPLENVAKQLSIIDPEETALATLKAPPRHENNELGLVVSRTNELLDRIRLQQRNLVHREKITALGSMLAEVAHELNNPLAVVSAQAELLSETSTDPKIQERAQKILRPAKRCSSIVRKFLTLAQQRKIEKKALNVNHLINESIEMLRFQLNRNEIEVHTDIDTDIIRILGDDTQLGQVIVNLLNNALQSLASIEGKKEIRIRAHTDIPNSNVIISITDNGPGIPKEIQQKVFDHFFTTKQEGRGTGLGLSFCKSVIEAHSGTISLKNVEPHGTEVVVEISGTTDAETVFPVRAHPGESLPSLQVLVVDGEESLSSSIAEVLFNYGHSAVTATNVRNAMALLQKKSFDVILADVHIPDIDGMAFYLNVKSLNSTLAKKFIFITGDALDQKLVDFFETEKTPYLNKPFEMAELIAAVENVILAPSTTTQLSSKKQVENDV